MLKEELVINRPALLEIVEKALIASPSSSSCCLCSGLKVPAERVSIVLSVHTSIRRSVSACLC